MLNRTTDRVVGAICLLVLVCAGTGLVMYAVRDGAAGAAQGLASDALGLWRAFRPWRDPLAAGVVFWVVFGAACVLFARRSGESRRTHAQVWALVVLGFVFLLLLWFSAASRTRDGRRVIGGSDAARCLIANGTIQAAQGSR